MLARMRFSTSRFKRICCPPTIGFLGLAALTLGMGFHNGPAGFPLTLEALLAYCGLPSECGADPAWIGQTVSIEGYVDPVNSFDKGHYPQLPYEKFKLIDRLGRSVEIWPQAQDNRRVFEKLAGRPPGSIIINGRLAAVQIPVNNKCTLGLKVLIHDAEQIRFREK